MSGALPRAVARMPALVRDTLSRPLPMSVTTLNADGSPQVSLVWQEPQGDAVVFFADVTSQKVANLRRNPRIVALVVDDQHSLGTGVPCYVVVHGHAVIAERDDALVHRLTQRYMQLAEYPFGPVDPYVAIRIHPHRFGGNLERGVRR
jgi:PPOX class probable F420-dependent enzyme